MAEEQGRIDSSAARGHVPVLLDEVLEKLVTSTEDKIFDGTVGLGGHAEAVLSRLGTRGFLLGVDRDEEALEKARERLQKSGKRFYLFRGLFTQIENAIAESGLERGQLFNGVILDLGVSSYQLDTAARGFSFQRDGPLDMRMSRSGQTAADWLASIPEAGLKQVLREYGEERHAAKISRAIVKRRKSTPIRTTWELAKLVEEICPRAGSRIHPATRTFQAIRIAVNSELELLREFLAKIDRFMAPKARLIVLSYHSLEDRLVKHGIRKRVKEGIFERVQPEWIGPGPEEVKRNPRARSVRLRWTIRRGG